MKAEEKVLVYELLNAIERNTTGLWVDDLSETVDCVILSEEYIKEGDEAELRDHPPTHYTGINKAIENLTRYMEDEQNDKLIERMRKASD